MIVVLCLTGIVAGVAAQDDNSGPIGPIDLASSMSPAHEIKYDDGFPEDHWAFTSEGIFFQGRRAVRFTPYYNPDLLVKVRFWVDPAKPLRGVIRIHVLDSSFTELIIPYHTTPSVTPGWNDVDVSVYGLTFTSDFYIAIEYTAGFYNYVGIDYNGPFSGRSWYHMSPGGWSPLPAGGVPPGNWLIRAGVQQLPGGVIPETPFGTVTAGLMMLLGIAIYSLRKANFSL